VSNLLEGVVLALKIIGVPSIILGFVLVLVMTGQSIYERRGDVLVFRAFGLRSRAILSLFMIEIVSLILIAGAIAYIIAHAIAFALNRFLFSFTDFVFDLMPIPIILGMIVLVSLFACIVAGRLTAAPLKNLLAEK
jgi:putative ABC transport system permease protein